MGLKGKILGVLIGVTAIWGFAAIQNVQAEIASDQAFENVSWEMVQEQGRSGVVQSICCTEDYIICIENVSDNPADFDIVYYFYKNNVDENGNPVEQYALAKTISNMSYEHGNGMAYNPNTKEIVISLYTNNEGEENRGTVYVMDASTFDLKRKVKISNDYNILGIGYREESDQYVIQTNVDGNYSFKILNSEFQIVEELGDYADTAEGSNFQDLCTDGDYIINFPLTLNLGIGDIIHMYSISRRSMVAANQLNWGFEGISSDEPESLCETSPGEFVAVVNVVFEDGTSTFRLYKTMIPYNFTITTFAEDGIISESSQTVLRGESYTVSYEPKENYRIDTISVDNQLVDTEKNESSYTFADVQGNHTISVNCVEMTLTEKIKAFFTKEKKDSASADKENVASDTNNATRASKTTAKIHIPKGLIFGILIVLFLLGAFALYLRVLYVRRMRIIKRRRAARARQRVMESYERMDADELEDREMREYVHIR